jgi:hypothetical protein
MLDAPVRRIRACRADDVAVVVDPVRATVTPSFQTNAKYPPSGNIPPPTTWPDSLMLKPKDDHPPG